MTNNKVILLLDQFPVITLDNGVTICNFSSFHDYWEFEYHKADPNNPDWIDVNLNMEMDSHTIKDLCTLAEMKELHVILVPYPIQAILNKKWNKSTKSYIIWCKSRTCRKIDPRDITQGIYSNKFCV